MSTTLSADAIEMLKAAAASKSGDIRVIRTFGGLSVSAGGREFAEAGDRRSEARWEAAIEELERVGFVKALTYKREIFEVTYRGYKFVDAVSAGSLAVQKEAEPERKIGFPLPSDRGKGETRV